MRRKLRFRQRRAVVWQCYGSEVPFSSVISSTTDTMRPRLAVVICRFYTREPILTLNVARGGYAIFTRNLLAPYCVYYPKKRTILPRPAGDINNRTMRSMFRHRTVPGEV